MAMRKATVAECACPHCATMYPLVDQLMGRPVRCRQCRGVFYVENDGRTRPVISNRPAPPPATDADAPTSAEGDALEPNAEPLLGLSADALQRRERPSTKRLSAAGSSAPHSPNPSQPVRKASALMGALRPQHLAGGIQDALRRRETEPSDQAQSTGEPSADIDLSPPSPAMARSPDPDLMDVAPARPQRRASSVFRRNTETIMSAMRRSMLGQGGGTRVGLNPAIAQALNTPPKDAASDRGDESTRAIPAVRPPEATPVPAQAAAVESQAASPAFSEPAAPTQTVHCPHCATAYPFLLTLLDRSIRCRSCQGVFRVFADASAEPVIANRPLPAATASGGSAGAGPRPRPKAATRVLRNRDLVKAMSSNLAEVVAAATASEREGTAATRPRDRSEAIHRRVVVAEGQRERHAQRWWWLASVAALLLILLAAGWLIQPGEPQRALRAFTQVAAAADGHQARRQAIREGAWPTAAVVQPVVGFGRLRLQSAMSLVLPDLAPLETALASRRYLPEWQLWIPESRLDEAQALISARQRNGSSSRTAVIDQLVQQVEALAPSHLQAMVDRLPTSNRGRQLLADLFAAPESPLLHQIRQNPPQSVEILPFSGTNGRLLLPTGQLRDCQYRGQLVRFHGDGYGPQWRVWELRASGLDPDFAPPPR